MNLILENSHQVRFFTDVGLVIEALGIECSDYDWYVSDVETNIPCSELDGSGSGQWLTGAELKSILTRGEMQFIWGVFSAVPKGLRPKITNAPFADGNSKYWSDPGVKPQLAGAEFEIACWDSGATILVGISDSQSDSFRARFSDARSLISKSRQL